MQSNGVNLACGNVFEQEVDKSALLKRLRGVHKSFL